MLFLLVKNGSLDCQFSEGKEASRMEMTRVSQSEQHGDGTCNYSNVQIKDYKR